MGGIAVAGRRRVRGLLGLEGSKRGRAVGRAGGLSVLVWAGAGPLARPFSVRCMWPWPFFPERGFLEGPVAEGQDRVLVGEGLGVGFFWADFLLVPEAAAGTGGEVGDIFLVGGADLVVGLGDAFWGRRRLLGGATEEAEAEDLAGRFLGSWVVPLWLGGHTGPVELAREAGGT